MPRRPRPRRVVGHSHPKVSLARLEEFGLVARAEAPHDRRVEKAELTPERRRFSDGVQALIDARENPPGA
ncbi:hypothetical protein ACFYTC_34055 [Actinomadura nitritigenes]|uniref:hypothetical protein n=1 Tax=Actinomadura nitritigenes TaxID=134602 RepID=UPI00367A23CE